MPSLEIQIGADD